MTYNEIYTHVYEGPHTEINSRIGSLSQEDRTAWFIIRMLSDRKGFDDWFSNIDAEYQDEIFEELKAMLPYQNPTT